MEKKTLNDSRFLQLPLAQTVKAPLQDDPEPGPGTQDWHTTTWRLNIACHHRTSAKRFDLKEEISPPDSVHWLWVEMLLRSLDLRGNRIPNAVLGIGLPSFE